MVTIYPHEPPWITCNLKLKDKKKKKKVDRGKDFIAKQDSQARNNIGQDFGLLKMKLLHLKYEKVRQTMSTK